MQMGLHMPCKNILTAQRTMFDVGPIKRRSVPAGFVGLQIKTVWELPFRPHRELKGILRKKQKAEIKTVQSGDTWRIEIKLGLLTASETEQTIEMIAALKEL